MATRTNLELLILALIERGLSTAYDLNTRAGLSVAASLAALARLKRARLIAGRRGSRRSVHFSITPRGKTVLKSGLRQIGSSTPRDVEAVIRVAYLLWLDLPQKTAVRNFLQRAAQDRRRQAVEQRSRAEELAALSSSAPGTEHRWMRAFVASRQLDAESEALQTLATRLP